MTVLRFVCAGAGALAGQHQLSLANELVFDELEHFLVRDAGALHFVRIARQDFADFLIHAVFDRHFVGHHLANVRRERFHVFRLDHFRGEQALDDFEILIEAPNADLYAWVVGDAPAPVRYDTQVLRQLIGFHALTIGGKAGEGG